MTELLSVTKQDGVAQVVIDNPPMNVLSAKVMAELDDVFSELETDNTVISI